MSGSPEDPLVAVARASGVRDERVLAAVAATPRTAFAPEDWRDVADEDRPLPIPHGLVTTQPSLVALMVSGLGLAGGERVLEVGTGYGYQTALLASLAAEVISVEIWPDLAERARENLARAGVSHVRVVVADGSQGYPPGAPYDAVLVSAAFPDVPPPLVAQLRQGGRLVQPIGPGGNEEVTAFERSGDGLRRLRVLTPASFVRLHGRHGFPGLVDGRDA